MSSWSSAPIPTDGHPVFASQMKRRLRQGAKLIVIDPRAIDLVHIPACQADYHLKLRPGTNVAADQCARPMSSSPKGLMNEAFIAERCDAECFPQVEEFVADKSNSRKPSKPSPVFRRPTLRGAARLYATGGNARDLLRPGRHRTQPGLHHGDRHRQSGDGNRQHRPRRCRRQPAARPEQRAGLVRHGLVPA